MKVDLRATHYKIGDQGRDFSTTGKFPDFGSQIYSQAKPSMKLWGTHYSLGDLRTNYETTSNSMSRGVKEKL